MLNLIIKSSISFVAKKLFPNITQKQIDDVIQFVFQLSSKAKSNEELISLAKQHGLTNESVQIVKNLALNTPYLSQFTSPEKAEANFNKYFGDMK